MKWFKRLFGLLIIFLCVVGILSCFSAGVTTWLVLDRTNTLIANVSEKVDEALGMVENRTTQIKKEITAAQDSARKLNDRVQWRLAESLDVPLDEAPDIDQIERQLYARIQITRDWLRLIQGTVDMVEQLVDIFQSTSLFLQQESYSTRDILGAVRDGKRELNRTVGMADDIQASLEAIREHRDVEENAKKIRTISSTIDKSLSTVIGYVTAFETGVITLRVQLKEIAEIVQWRLFYVAIGLTAMLLWLVVAQGSLAVHGWKLFRSVKPVDSSA